MANGYETPSEDESAGTVSPVEVESREAPGSKRRMAPSGNSQREAKSRRTGEVGSMSAPGHGQGPNGPRGPGGGSGGNPNAPPGYNELGGMGIDQRVLLEDVYGRHGPKREELADQKLMDELKKELGDPLQPMISQVQARSQSASAARSLPTS